MPEQPPSDRFEQAKARFVEGLAHHRAGAFAEAEQHYLRALALLPGRASTLINLAATQLRLARPLDALASANAALEAEADSVDALLHRATALAELGRRSDALAAFQRLLAIDPGHALAWSSTGSLLREMQRPGEAAQAFREALRHGADPELHGYYLASVTAGETPSTAPRVYVQQLFDSYADAFDQHLVGQLNYQAHRQLIDGLAAVDGGPYASAIDLGCGTGLCGPLLRPLVQRLTGVDLSVRMLERARALGVYNRLEHADVVEFLCRGDEPCELLVAADVFIYVGALHAVFEGARHAMARGVFCFSVELADDADDYRLLPSLRYAHSKRYLLRLARQHGFEPIGMSRAAVRQDQREAIDGLFVYLRRQ